MQLKLVLQYIYSPKFQLTGTNVGTRLMSPRYGDECYERRWISAVPFETYFPAKDLLVSVVPKLLPFEQRRR